MSVTYRPNNLIFRIASATAISKFKELQAHSFLQVSRADMAFDPKVKEALLVTYDRFSRWVFHIEGLFLDCEEGSPLGNDFAESISDKYLSELENIKATFMMHSEFFKPEVSIFLGIIFDHDGVPTRERIKNKVAKLNPPEGFAATTEVLNDFLQIIVLSLHEFNNNVCRDKTANVINVSALDLLDLDSTDEWDASSIAKRAVFFNKRWGISSFLIKNYTQMDVLKNQKMTLVIKNLSKMGIMCAVESASI